MRYFYIDTENAQKYNFMDEFNINSDDKIIMFISEKSKNFTPDDLRRFIGCKSKIYFEDVHTGSKNALDFQLIANLSMTISINENDDKSYYIISNDNDFDLPVDYLRNKTNANITIVKTDVNSMYKVESTCCEDEQSIFAKLNLNEEVISIVKNATALNILHNNLRRKYGDRGTSLYKQIKPYFKSMMM